MARRLPARAPPVVAVLALAILVAGCAAPSFCTRDRLSVEGTASGLLAALQAPPDDLAPTRSMHLEPWQDGDVRVEGLITSGRPAQLEGDVERMFALWYGATEGGVLMVWQGGEVEVQVYADDASSRDRLLDAVRDAAPGADWGASTRQPRDPPYFHDLAGPPVPDPWVLRLPADAFTMDGLPKQSPQERHVGWWAWALSHERSLASQDGAGSVEVSLRFDGSFSGQVRGDGDERALRDRFERFLARWDVEPTLDGLRYDEGDCDLLPPET